MRKFKLALIAAAVCGSFLLAQDAEAGCLRGGARAARAVAGKAVGVVRRVLPPWRR